MKKIKVITLIIILALVLPLAACNSSGKDAEVGKYDEIVVFNISEGGDTVIGFEAEAIEKITFMSRTIDNKQYSFDSKRGELIVKAAVFADADAGDKTLKVYVGGKAIDITIRMLTKMIYTVEDFNYIRNDLSGTYMLGADLDFSSVDYWPIGMPVGTETRGKFDGTLDGSGHYIKNITIGYGSGYNMGLFYEIGGNALIENLNVVNARVNVNGLSGAIAGTNGGTIRNCYVFAKLTSRGTYEHCGGIAGINGTADAAGVIENCVSVIENVWVDGWNMNRLFADWNSGSVKNCYGALIGAGDDVLPPEGWQNITAEQMEKDGEDNPDPLNMGILWNLLPAVPGAFGDNPNFVEGGSEPYKNFYPQGTIDSVTLTHSEMKKASNFDKLDKSVWHVQDGVNPYVITRK